jgi:hypothetical protein
MAVAAQTAAAAEAAAASFDLYTIDKTCRRWEARDTRRRATAWRHTAASHTDSFDGSVCFG